MLDTTEEKKRFLASSELSYDPLYQPTMDSMWHHWLQPKWAKEFVAWKKKSEEVERSRW